MNAYKWLALSAIIATFQMSACGGDDDNGTGAGTGGSAAHGGTTARGGTSGRGGSGQAGIGNAGIGNAGGGGTGGTRATGGTGGRGGTGGTTAGAAGAAANAGIGGAAGEGAGAGGEGGAVAVLNDGEILDVAYTANQAEIAEAQIAVTRATSTAVYDFAQIMINDHTAAAANVVTVSTTTNITLTSNAVSQKLANDAADEATALNSAAATDFDALYMDRQIEDHQSMLDLLNRTLIEQANNSEVRVVLASMKSTVSGHLAAAQQIRDGL